MLRTQKLLVRHLLSQVQHDLFLQHQLVKRACCLHFLKKNLLLSERFVSTQSKAGVSSLQRWVSWENAVAVLSAVTCCSVVAASTESDLDKDEQPPKNRNARENQKQYNISWLSYTDICMLLYEAYSCLDQKCGIASCATIPDSEEDTIDASGGHSAYGEILPHGVKKLMDTLMPEEGFVFYDLGSGLGKMAAQVALQYRPSLSCGIELSKTRHAAAIQAKQSMEKILQTVIHNLTFRNDDIHQTDVSDANVVYIASLCFDEQFLTSIAERITLEAQSIGFVRHVSQ